ncbi:tripartite tricarboxylate transporter permease [Acuticoccus kandeliae]|uniref:tripartite tricarboxylate transporter permease n=1 Tax=Acuticoccus kandeliae TaxID=2073160 RepID=UPI000D3ED6F3|nr:tripartite tricarboxylate transporter permease [Acuticoccus kandeliae]
MWPDLSAAVDAITLLSTSWTAWAVVPVGLIIGLVFGAVPGMQVSMAMAIFLPTTLYMDFLTALLFLTSIFTGGGFGGGVSAILMNIPGTSTSVATAFDGYPMTQQGRQNEALGLALGASCVGTFFSYLLLFLLIGPMSIFVLKVGPLEMLFVVLWGVTLIGILSGDSALRGLLAGAVGLLIGTIGMSPTSNIRGTLGFTALMDGVPVVPAMLGLFAISELLGLMHKDYLVQSQEARRLSFTQITAGARAVFRHPMVVLRGGLIGSLIGAIPGVGSSISNLVSYAETRRRDPDPASFGRGNPKGVIAAESANSSSEGGSMVTLLALGLPGGGGTAVMLAAFAMHNVTGGPRFIREQTDIVYAIIFGNFIQAILLFVIGLFTIHLVSAVVKVPIRYLVASVLAVAVFGAYGLTGNMVGPYTLLAFGALGWVMRRYGYSIPAAVVGLLLGRLADTNLVYVYQISGGYWDYILERPIAMGILALFLVTVVIVPLYKSWRTRRGGPDASLFAPNRAPPPQAGRIRPASAKDAHPIASKVYPEP